MKNWIAKLLSDSSNLPSTRLHLSWLLAGLLCFYIIWNTCTGKDIQVEVLWALISGMAAMSGLSVMDHGGTLKKETK